MQKRSSKKNKLVCAVCILAALSLCLGGFFVFSPLTKAADGQNADSFIYSNESYFVGGAVDGENFLSISAKSAILIEVGSGEVVFSKDPDTRMPMASTTKIMTALVALENCDPGKTVTVSADATNIEGSSIYLYPEEQMTMLDLLYAMLLESANDAAAAIAIEIGGDIEGFASLMNKKAEALGLTDTHFENPHGLDENTHYTTARELAIIAREAYRNPTLREIFSTYKRTIPLNGGDGVRLLINHNKLLKSYEGATGIKTGYTKKSGRCLVSAAERDGLEFIAVTLNAPDDWSDHKKMLDMGFEKYEARQLCIAGEHIYTLPTVGAIEDHVFVAPARDIRVVTERGAGDVECVFDIPRFVYAPLGKGEVVGYLEFYLDGKLIAKTELTSLEALNGRREKGIFERIFGG